MTPSKESFWKTLPGILTGIATLLTALGGFILILVQLGVFSPAAKDTTSVAQQSAVPPKMSTPTMTTNLTAIADDIEYTVLSRSTAEYSSTELKLTLNMKVSCRENSVNFESSVFRLELEGIKYAPINELSNHWIENHADWKESLEFIIPKDLRSATLLVGRVGTPRIGKIFITLP